MSKLNDAQLALAPLDAEGPAPLRSWPRVALVHDWLDTYAGSEKVVEQMLAVFPAADVYSTVDFVPERQRAFLGGRTVRTSFIQRLPFARRKFRSYLPLMPFAVEQFDLSGYDIVVSSCHAVSKGVLTGPHQLHVSYVHSPMRYAWDLQHQYLAESGLTRNLKGIVARLMLHYLRMWDLRTAPGVDVFLANSHFIRRRIAKVYRRDAQVVYPPVDLERFPLRPAGQPRGDYYLTVSRMVPYKRVPLIVEAFTQMPDLRLKVIGDGGEFDKVRQRAGPNVELLGFREHEELLHHMQSAKAFVFAAEEDFGITPVEAQACGTPVIAYGRGGSLETVRGEGSVIDSDASGLFFAEQSVAAIVEAVRRYEARPAPIDAAACRAHAERFSIKAFRQSIGSVVAHHWQSHCQSVGVP
jgi:glycosyltransferase involved in cell wall biosynthesis